MPDATARRTSAERRFRRLVVALAVAAGAAAAVGSLIATRDATASGGALPGPRPSRAGDPLGENASCEACHADIAAEQRGSEHASAFSDPVFQHAFAIEPTAFCRGCHAPESPVLGGDERTAALGVACVTCHLAGDVVLAAPGRGVSFAPHRVERSEAFAASGGCGGCHEFSFGDDERREAPLPMQSTVDEHARSPHAGKSCADCHMPRGADGRRSHAFSSTRDVASHRRAVRVNAERTSPTGVTLSLELEGVGHAYPTGDLFRRVAVQAEVMGADFRVLASKTRYLGRHFTTGRDLEGRPIRIEARDDRIQPDAATVVELELGEAAQGRPIAWSVTLDRVLHVRDHFESVADVPDSVVLSVGEVMP